MADEQKPKLDLAAIQGGAALKAVDAPADASLAQASILAAIQGQGVISAVAERLPQNNDSLNRALILNEIGKQGVISAQVEEAGVSPALQHALLLNAISHQGVISVPEGHAPNRSLTQEQLVALQAEAAQEKKEISEGLASQKAKLDLSQVVAGAALNHVEPPTPSSAGLDRGNLLHEINAAGGKSADVSKIPAAAAADQSLAQASILAAIKTQGVISVPEGSAPDRALTDEQKAALLADAKAEKKEDAENLEAHKAKLDLSGLGGAAAGLQHVDAPVVDNSASLAHAGLLNELAKKT